LTYQEIFGLPISSPFDTPDYDFEDDDCLVVVMGCNYPNHQIDFIDYKYDDILKMVTKKKFITCPDAFGVWRKKQQHDKQEKN